MSVNLASKFQTGLAPHDFIESMAKNKEAFRQWYDSFRWEDEGDREYFAGLASRSDLACLILAAEWCGDVVRNVPVVFRAMETAAIPTEVLIIEQHPEVMEQFLTNGGRAIPIVIFTNRQGEVLGKWGPRPSHVQAVMTAFKQQNPDRNAPEYEERIKIARAQMMQEYGEGTAYQQVIVKELREVLSQVAI